MPRQSGNAEASGLEGLHTRLSANADKEWNRTASDDASGIVRVAVSAEARIAALGLGMQRDAVGLVRFATNAPRFVVGAIRAVAQKRSDPS